MTLHYRCNVKHMYNKIFVDGRQEDYILFPAMLFLYKVAMVTMKVSQSGGTVVVRVKSRHHEWFRHRHHCHGGGIADIIAVVAASLC